MKLLLLLFPVVLQAQITYTASKTTILSGAAEVVTVQQPATNSNVVRFIGAYIDSTAACAFTIERNGTFATGTTLTPRPINPDQQAGIATAWSGSDVGTGTVITRATVGAGGWFFIDLSRVYMRGNNTSINLSLRTASCTATVNIVISYSESAQ